MTLKAFTFLHIRIVIRRALILALLASLVAGTLGAHLLVEAIVGAELTAWMTLAANGLAGQWLECTLLLWIHIFPVVAIGALVVLAQATLHLGSFIDDGQAAGVTRAITDSIIGSGATLTGFVALAASSKIRVFIFRANGDAVLLIAHMDADVTVLGARSRAGETLRMAFLAGLRIELVGAAREKRERYSGLAELREREIDYSLTYLDTLRQSAMQVPL